MLFRSVSELIALVLQESHFQVVERSDFEDFQALIDDENPHLIIIDPSLNQGRYRANFYKIFLNEVNKGELKFLLLGPPECKKDYEELKVEGLVDYCVKPFSPKELNCEIHNLINAFGA